MKYKAIIFDMDGVLIDSEYWFEKYENQFFQSYVPEFTEKDRLNILGGSVKNTYQYIQNKYAISCPEKEFIESYTEFGIENIYEKTSLIQGVKNFLDKLKLQNIPLALASSSYYAWINKALDRLDLRKYFDFVVSAEDLNGKGKPAPDIYLRAAKLLKVDPKDCLVFEDSEKGVTSGKDANMTVYGIRNGVNDSQNLERTDKIFYKYSDLKEFENNFIKLKFGNVKNKKIITPNDFVSHMIEHIAWRTKTEIDLQWNNEEWRTLGEKYGEEFLSIVKETKEDESATLGFIDDGVAKVKIKKSENFSLTLKSTKNVDLDFFINGRCEQIKSHEPLTSFLQGLTKSLSIEIEIVVCNHRDSHHTWEGVFRGIGICMEKIFSPKEKEIDLRSLEVIEKNCTNGDIAVLQKSILKAEVIRGTAESGVKVFVDLSGDYKKSVFKVDVNDSIKTAVQNLDKLLIILAESLNSQINIDFTATALSSSHVVWEDIGLVLGRSLFEILNLRFEQFGANGQGSSIQTVEDFEKQNGAVGVSIEGRKLWQFIPSDGNFKKLNKNFLQFKNIFGSIRSEDLDDFFDGISGGMMASIMINIDQIKNHNELWQEVFRNLGIALKEAFKINSSRKGVPPGVKATLS